MAGPTGPFATALTNVSDAHCTTSWLDHIVCSFDMHSKVSSVQVIDKMPCSDHLPIVAAFDICNNLSKVQSRKVDKDPDDAICRKCEFVDRFHQLSTLFRQHHTTAKLHLYYSIYIAHDRVPTVMEKHRRKNLVMEKSLKMGKQNSHGNPEKVMEFLYC